MVVQYKCPNCGADMRFDATTGLLKCDACGNTMKIEDMPHIETEDESDGKEDAPEVNPFGEEDIKDEGGAANEIPSDPNSGEAHFTEADAENTVVYKCKNCGAEVVTTKDTAATVCSFCGAPVVIGERVTGALQPKYVIPFKITKQEAQEKFKKWCGHGLITPRGFMNGDRIKNITGLYVPYWLYDVNSKGYADATCTRVKTYTRGNYRYTETSYFHVYRGFNMQYAKVPVDASERMNDELMDKAEPFNYADIKDFNAPYLAGYLAEKYDYKAEDLANRLNAKVSKYVNEFVAKQFTGYHSVRYNSRNIDNVRQNEYYAMLPVWMVSYDYKNNEHMFIMNAQTGKVVGKPPISKAKTVAWFLGTSGIAFAIMRLLTMILT